MRRVVWFTLSVIPGILFVVSGLAYRLDLRRLERLEREFDVYPLDGGTVRVQPRGGWGRFTAVVADPDGPTLDLAWKDAVKFSWRRADSGPFERPEAGVLEVPHHGKPVDLLYSSSPQVRAALRVYPEGRPEISPRHREAEKVQWLLAGLWLGPWAAVLAWTCRGPR